MDTETDDNLALYLGCSDVVLGSEPSTWYRVDVMRHLGIEPGDYVSEVDQERYFAILKLPDEEFKRLGFD